MLPPGCIILSDEPFFFYDFIKADNQTSMRDTHYHNFYEIYFLVSGKCDYLIKDKVYSISSNSLIFIPKGMVHKTTYTSVTHQRIMLSFNESNIDSRLHQYMEDVKLCTISNDTLEQLTQLLRNLYKFSTHKDVQSQVLIKSYICQLFIFILQNNNNNISELIEDLPSPIEYAVTYIKEHYKEDISLKDLSAKIGYSADYFSRLFKEKMGSGFKQYVLMARLVEAENLLITTNKQIKEIAISCGFNDSNYFTYMFTKNYGMSPLRYKKANTSSTKKSDTP